MGAAGRFSDRHSGFNRLAFASGSACLPRIFQYDTAIWRIPSLKFDLARRDQSQIGTFLFGRAVTSVHEQEFIRFQSILSCTVASHFAQGTDRTWSNSWLSKDLYESLIVTYQSTGLSQYRLKFGEACSYLCTINLLPQFVRRYRLTIRGYVRWAVHWSSNDLRSIYIHSDTEHIRSVRFSQTLL